MKPILTFILLLFLSCPVVATEVLSAGYIKGLSYRGGFVMFKVVDNGVNYCSQCPVDPGAMGVGRCWVDESKSSQISMLITAKATNKPISGRVYSFSTNCTIYQMTVGD